MSPDEILLGHSFKGRKKSYQFFSIVALTKHVKKYTIERVLAPLIQDLKTLEEDGVKQGGIYE